MTRERMETADEDFVKTGLDFIDRAHKAQKTLLRMDEHHPHARPGQG